MNNPEQLGGELVTLWNIGKKQLPTAENVFIENLKILHKHNGSVDNETYGDCHAGWVAVAQGLERVMHHTSMSLQDTANGVIEAMNAFKYVDGENAKGLSAIGKELEKRLDAYNDTEDWVPVVQRDDYGPASESN